MSPFIFADLKFKPSLRITNLSYVPLLAAVPVGSIWALVVPRREEVGMYSLRQSSRVAGEKEFDDTGIASLLDTPWDGWTYDCTTAAAIEEAINKRLKEMVP